jgi:hypothetical protein
VTISEGNGHPSEEEFDKAWQVAHRNNGINPSLWSQFDGSFCPSLLPGGEMYPLKCYLARLCRS